MGLWQSQMNRKYWNGNENIGAVTIVLYKWSFLNRDPGSRRSLVNLLHLG